MVKPRITFDDIASAAEELLSIGISPSVEKVLHRIGRGSRTTINKHLQIWKEQVSTPEDVVAVSKDQKNKIKQLENQLDSQTAASEKLIAELSQVKFEESAQLAKITSLQQELAELKLHVKVLNTTNENLSNSSSQLARQFADDLKFVNESCLKKVQDIGFKAQDQWMDEKLKVRSLKEELAENKKENRKLVDELATKELALAPLKKKIFQQEKIISHCLDPKKLESYKLIEEGADCD